MNIIISNNSTKPIYEQITFQIKASIMSGELESNQLLPSMRALAKSLHISVITVQRAYEDLQKEGFIQTLKGKGTFVSSRNKDFIKEEELRRIEKKLEEVVEISKSNDISLDKLIEILTMFYLEEE